MSRYCIAYNIIEIVTVKHQTFKDTQEIIKMHIYIFQYKVHLHVY